MLTVSPEKNCQMSIKVAQKWFHYKKIHFDTFPKIAYECVRFWLINCCQKALKSCPKSNRSPNLVTLDAINPLPQSPMHKVKAEQQKMGEFFGTKMGREEAKDLTITDRSQERDPKLVYFNYSSAQSGWWCRLARVKYSGGYVVKNFYFQCQWVKVIPFEAAHGAL